MISRLKSRQGKSELERLLRRDAYNLRLSQKEVSISCDNGELEFLSDIIDECSSIDIIESLDQDQPPMKEKRMNYKEFLAVKFNLEEHSINKFTSFFTASLFLHFPTDSLCRISSDHFYNFVLRRLSLDQARLDLAKYDSNHDGHLTEEDLSNYISDMMPLMHLPNITQAFKKFYVCTAIRKFLFFMDKNKSGKICIHQILTSPILTELFELRDTDESSPSEKSNWFSSHSALRVYGQFLNLDKDHNGLLSRTEMSAYNNGSFTEILLDRLFAECQTYRNEASGDNELDFSGFLDFVIAVENAQTAEGIAFFFKLLDMHYTGFIDQFTLSIFIKAVLGKMMCMGYEEIGEADLTNEIFDMANPMDPTRFTLKDMVSSGVGGTIISILSDVRGFWAYENRETLEHKDEQPVSPQQR